jgi:hypothetical protein
MKKRELSKRIEKLSKRIEEVREQMWNIHEAVFNVKVEINKKFDNHKREQDEKYQMLLNYFKLEEKEYAELEEQGKFRTFKDISNLIGEPINIEAVKKTKLVKKKVGKTDIPQTGRI